MPACVFSRTPVLFEMSKGLGVHGPSTLVASLSRWTNDRHVVGLGCEALMARLRSSVPQAVLVRLGQLEGCGQVEGVIACTVCCVDM